MDQWHVVSEGRWDGVLFLTVRKGRAYAYRSVAYYDEFTEQNVFKAVARGHTDPRAYCMGCGGDEGALHENWCHAVKEAHRKKTAHRHGVAAFSTGWNYRECKSGDWHWVPFGNGQARCPDCRTYVNEPEHPRKPQKFTVSIGQRPTHATGVIESQGSAVSWWLIGCKSGVKATASISAVIGECWDCGAPVTQPGWNPYMSVHPEHSWLPGEKPPGPSPSEGQRRELAQPCATITAKAFHLRPPRREIVVLVDDQSEPP